MIHSASFRAWIPWDGTLGAPLVHIQLNTLPCRPPSQIPAAGQSLRRYTQQFFQEGFGQRTPSPSV